MYPKENLKAFKHITSGPHNKSKLRTLQINSPGFISNQTREKVPLLDF